MTDHPYSEEEVSDLKASGHWPEDETESTDGENDGDNPGMTPAEPFPPAE